jgi:hypothetical protein
MKPDPSSDCGLQLDSMKSESLVIVNQNAAVNTFPALYTPPVTPWELGCPEVASPNLKGGRLPNGIDS